MRKEVPSPVINYLRDQLLHRKELKQKAIQNTYNYWRATYKFMEEEFSEDKALKLLQEVADEIE